MTSKQPEFKTLLDDENLTTNFTSEALPVDTKGGYCVLASIAGEGSYTICLEASNDNVNWIKIKDSEEDCVVPEDYCRNVRSVFYNFVRVKIITGVDAALNIHMTFNKK